MASQTTFSDTNHGFQVGVNHGSVTNQFLPSERSETPPSPSLSIPFLRDPDFVDRGTILKQLHHQCAAPGSWTALVGLGGVGKSQLAIEYAYQIHEREPQTWVFWIYASNAARFEQSYRNVADTVKLSGRQDSKANIFRLVYNWLQDRKNGKWIVILDNVGNAEFLDRHEAVQGLANHENGSADRPLREYLPRSQNGRILITSRSKEVALQLVDRRDIVLVETMDQAEAVALFEKKSGKQDNRQDIIELTAALDFFPLAIVQAAAYISDPDRGCSVRQYLDEFRKSDRKKVRLLGRGEGQFRRDWEAENSVLTTWQISFDSIRESRRSAADLLSLMSFFDRQGIPEALLQSSSEKRNVDPSSSDDDDDDSQSQSGVTEEFEDDILILRRYSLISINADQRTFNMHGLVQLATRRWLEVHGELAKWMRQSIQNLNAKLPTGEYENWAQCQVLYPHAKSAASQRPHKRDSLMEWAAVLFKAAWYDWQKGSRAEGERLSLKAMEARMKYLGPEHEDTLESIGMVGLIYQSQGRWKEAQELFLQVVETMKRVLGAEHPVTLTSMANLASTYRDQGRWNEAENLELQVMEITKRVLGTEHPDTLKSMANLASTYQDQGRWNEAEDLELQVMEIMKRVLGTEHPDTLKSMANLASTYRDQGRWNEAEDLELQVVEIIKRVLGAEHPVTLKSMANLASTYRDQGRWNKAEDLELQVMEIMKRVLGTEHPDTLKSMANLASTYQDQGRWNEAENLGLPVMEIRKRVLGAEHPDTLTSMANLAYTWRSQGRRTDALALIQECCVLRNKVLGHNHPDARESYSALLSWQEEHQLVPNRNFPSAPPQIEQTEHLQEGQAQHFTVATMAQPPSPQLTKSPHNQRRLGPGLFLWKPPLIIASRGPSSVPGSQDLHEID
ncbi:kinesin [Penicillium chermesinum]|uniref:Kinesin n=1 Tax=Penicillium chermesinum TaxID=63820 RepID=A0A9W9PGG5_9EURO|nr:kinesin [Penicillium chermesinum]KAJ5246378.1 kinesin [Penicillium chermesinum]